MILVKMQLRRVTLGTIKDNVACHRQQFLSLCEVAPNGAPFPLRHHEEDASLVYNEPSLQQSRGDGRRGRKGERRGGRDEGGKEQAEKRAGRGRGGEDQSPWLLLAGAAEAPPICSAVNTK